jgi:hypothetical protein
MRVPTAKQRLAKHIPAQADTRNNTTSIARQQINKNISLTIEAVFSAWSVQSDYENEFGSIREVKSRVSGRQSA